MDPHNSQIASIGMRDSTVLASAWFVAFIFLVVSTIASLMQSGITLSFDLRATGDSKGEIFYSVGEAGYVAERSRPFAINADGAWHQYSLDLSSDEVITGIRVDPGASRGTADIRSLELGSGARTVRLVGEDLANSVNVINGIDYSAAEGVLSMRLESGDPYIGFTVPPLGARTTVVAVVSSIAPALAAGCVWLLLVLGARTVQRRRPAAGSHLIALLKQGGHAISDSRVLVVTPQILATMIGIALIAIAYVGLNLNQSSIGVWDEMFGPAAPKSVILGEPKSIRSDEWNVQTPWLLNQKANGFPLENSNIGGDRAPLVAGVPVLQPAVAANPKFLGFFVLDDPGRGLSWMWAFKTFGLFAGFLWLFLLLTRGDLPASLLGSAWVFGSSFVQWWFSSGLPEILSGFAFFCIGSIYLAFGARRGSMLVGVGMCILGACTLVTNIYPPFIVPLAYLGAALVIGLGTSIGGWGEVLRRPIFRLGALATALAVLALGLMSYLSAASETIGTMMSTIYPGQRISSPGGLDPRMGLIGMFEYLRIDQGRFPALTSNASEAGNFLVLAPLALLMIPLAAYLRRGFALVSALIVYLLVVAAWVFVELPSGISSAMQLLGWSYSPPFRALFGIGLGSICLCIVVLSKVRAGELAASLPRRGIAVLVACGVALSVGIYFRQLDPAFFSVTTIVLGAAIVAILMAGIGSGKASLTAAGLVLLIAPALTANPVSVGIDAIMRKPVLLDAAAVSSTSDRWVTVDDRILSQGLKAHGLDVFNGTRMVPDVAEMTKIDPARTHEGVWNRYASIIVSSAPGLPEIEYVLPFPDFYVMRLDVCGLALRELGVTRIAYPGAVPNADLRCLQEFPSRDASVRLFEVRYKD